MDSLEARVMARSTLLQIITESLPISSSTHVYFFATDTISRTTLWVAHLPTALIALWDVRTHLKHHSWYSLVRFTGITTAITVTAAGVLASLASYIHLFKPWQGLSITACLLLYQSTQKEGTKSLPHTIPLRTALWIGCAQGLAQLPGISRLAFVYTIATQLGYRHEDAWFLTWLSAIPLFSAASFVGGIMNYTEIINNATLSNSLMIGIALLIAAAAFQLSKYCFKQHLSWIFVPEIVLLIIKLVVT